MNILILNWRDPKHPLAGGAEQMVLEHAKVWKSKGNNIIWIASSFDKAKKSEFINGIKIIRRGSHFTVHFWTFINFLKGEFNNIDLVIDCFHFIPYFSAFYFTNKRVVAIIQEVAGKLWFDNLNLPIAFMGYLIEPLIIKSYKNVPFITGSKSAKKDMQKIGFKGREIFVIPHGINRLRIKYQPKEKTPTLIFLGRVSKDKGIEDALRAIKVVSKKYQNLKFFIIGKPESELYLKKVKDLSRELGVDKYCSWVGFVSQQRKFELLAKSWLLIHPSKKEGWGLNVIEANSVKTPAIGYEVGGLTDSILNNKTGLLVKPDFNNLARAIDHLFSSKELLKNLSVNSYEWSLRFSWEKSGENSWKIIKKKLDKSKELN